MSGVYCVDYGTPGSHMYCSSNYNYLVLIDLLHVNLYSARLIDSNQMIVGQKSAPFGPHEMLYLSRQPLDLWLELRPIKGVGGIDMFVLSGAGL